MRTCSNASGSATSPRSHPPAQAVSTQPPRSGPCRVDRRKCSTIPLHARPKPSTHHGFVWTSRRVVSSSSTLSVPEIIIEPPVSSSLSACARLTRFPVPPRINHQPHQSSHPAYNMLSPSHADVPFPMPAPSPTRRDERKEGVGAGQRVQRVGWLRIWSWIWVW
jgi:hypothetical protein